MAKRRSEWAEQELGQAELGDARRTKHPRRGVSRAAATRINGPSEGNGIKLDIILVG